MTDGSDKNRQQQTGDRRGEAGQARSERKPFDTSDLQRLPYPNENDPPYRPFWVDDGNDRN
jgi:hypothetical protein